MKCHRSGGRAAGARSLRARRRLGPPAGGGVGQRLAAPGAREEAGRGESAEAACESSLPLTKHPFYSTRSRHAPRRGSVFGEQGSRERFSESTAGPTRPARRFPNADPREPKGIHPPLLTCGSWAPGCLLPGEVTGGWESISCLPLTPFPPALLPHPGFLVSHTPSPMGESRRRQKRKKRGGTQLSTFLKLEKDTRRHAVTWRPRRSQSPRRLLRAGMRFYDL